MPEKMGFLPEIGAKSLSLLSVLALQDNSFPQISLPASKGHAGCVGSGFICLRLTYQNYTVANEVQQPAVTNTFKQAPLPAATPSLWTHSSSGQGCLLAWPIPAQVPPSSPTTRLPPVCPGSAPHAALAFDGLMIHV